MEKNSDKIETLSEGKDSLKGQLMAAYKSSEFPKLKKLWNERKTKDANQTSKELNESLKRMMSIKAGLKKNNRVNIDTSAQKILGDKMVDFVFSKIEKFIESSDRKIKELGGKIYNYTSLDTLKDFIVQNDKDGELLNNFLPRLTDIKFISGDSDKLKSIRDEINSFLDERREKYKEAA